VYRGYLLFKGIKYAGNNCIFSQGFAKVTDRLWDVEDIVNMIN